MDKKIIDHGNGIKEIHYADGTKVWYKNNLLHREDGPAMEHSNGDKEWFYEGEPHRSNAPAVERANGAKRWYHYGKLHREDGPAIENSDGTNAWALNGVKLTESEVNTILWNKELNQELSTNNAIPKKIKI